MNPIFDGFAAMGSIGAMIAIIFGIIAMLAPFFILRIRNESINSNKKLDRIIELLETQSLRARPGSPHPAPLKKMKCPVCRAVNNAASDRCSECNAVLHPDKILRGGSS